MLEIREDAAGITFDVLVQPRASKEKIGPVHGGRLKVSVNAPPVDDAANQAVIALLAKAARVSRSQVTVIRGERSRRKTVRIEGVDRERLDELLELKLSYPSRNRSRRQSRSIVKCRSDDR